MDKYYQFLDSVPEPKQRLPQVIQFPVNDICNSHCQMCYIWKRKKAYEVTPDDIRKILSNRLFREVTGVGINGGEPTLRKDLGEVVSAVLETLPRIKEIHLITNAINDVQVINALKEVGAVCRGNDVGLNVMVSLDGIGQVHDRVRGTKGNFETAVKVIDFIIESSFVDCATIGCTVIKENVFDVENVLNWCQDRKLYARFRLGIPHRRLYTENIRHPFNLNYQEKFHFANFLDNLYYHYEKNEARRAFYRSLRDQVIYHHHRKSGCIWKNKGVTLSSQGEMYYCAVESKTLGNILHENPWDVYWSNSDHLKNIVQNKCAKCLHDYDGIADRKILLRHVARNVLEKSPDSVRRALINTAQEIYCLKEKSRIRKAGKSLRTISNTYVHRSNKILICGWYGTETLGDKAILGGLVSVVRNISDKCLVDVVAINPYVTQMTTIQMPELKINSVIDFVTAKKAIEQGEYDCVVMGGGPLMSSISECTDILDLFVLAKKRGIKTVIAGCGVGPLSVSWRNKSIEMLLNIADVTMLRDRSSLGLARKKLGFTGHANTILCPSFLWIRESLPPDITRNDKQILLALRDWPIQEYASHIQREKALEVKATFESELVKLVEELISIDPDIEIVPFCMHKLAIGGDDRAFYRNIFSDFPDILRNLDNLHRNPVDDLKLIMRSRAILAMRFHSVVFSLATKTPFIAIDYTLGGKIKGLLSDLKADDCRVELKDFNGRSIARRLLDQSFNVLTLDNEIKKTEKVLTTAFEGILNK